jgi:succinyl-CoA synthetase beta subunit
MNIHEHQATETLKEFGAPISNGVVIFSIDEIKEKIVKLKSKTFVLKAQIHAGGRGKGGGVKLVKNINDLEKEAKQMMGKVLVTHQTGSEGKKVKRLYIEEASDISKELYLSCLIDRETSKIAFISSTEGGMDIEKVAFKTPNKIITNKMDFKKDGLDENEIEKIISIFKFNDNQKKTAKKIIKSLYEIIIKKDASLIEINPLIITKSEELICLDAKMNFDDNAIFRRPEILKLRDLNEEDPAETEARKYDLAYIKLNGSIGCMVNGAGLAMATMDIIKLYGKEPANFLDVGGGASKEKVAAAFKLILSDKNVKGILINIFGGIMRCDVLAQGVVDAAKDLNLSVPLVVRLAGTNFKEGKEILENSDLKILSASDLNDAAKKIVEAIK